MISANISPFARFAIACGAVSSVSTLLYYQYRRGQLEVKSSRVSSASQIGAFAVSAVLGATCGAACAHHVKFNDLQGKNRALALLAACAAASAAVPLLSLVGIYVRRCLGRICKSEQA
ncbi:MAG: hypothetical protein MHM6MM_007593 [Cercozoa sp. M6MM]